MSFGLTNTPVGFQEYMNKILIEIFDIIIIVYLDDIFIYTDDNRNGHILAI